MKCICSLLFAVVHYSEVYSQDVDFRILMHTRDIYSSRLNQSASAVWRVSFDEINGVNQWLFSLSVADVQSSLLRNFFTV